MATVTWDLTEIIAFILFGVLTLPLFVIVHRLLDYCCVSHARKFCKRKGLEVRRSRWQPAFDKSGAKRVKTEFTLVQLDCLDAQKERRLVLLLVFPFGVRKFLSDEKYPDPDDLKWPAPKNQP